MDHADITRWLSDVTPDSPCGEDEEYSAEFRALEQAVAGKPGAQYGETVIPATPPDWAAARSLAGVMLERARDLRVAVHYTRASLMRDGVSGMARGLALVEGFLDTHWQNVHPQLDASDGNDPTARVNAMSGLIEGGALPADLRDVPLVSSRGQQGVTLRVIDLFTGEQPPVDGIDMPTGESIEAAFAQEGKASIDATLAALRASIASVGRIEALLTEHVGPTRALDFAPLTKVLLRIAGFVAAHAPASDPYLHQAAGENSTQPADADNPSQPAAAASRSTQIASAQDVIAALDAICTYYARYEPSSPLPVLLQRARRLVGKSFIEIIEDVAPDGVGQFRHLGGVA